MTPFQEALAEYAAAHKSHRLWTTDCDAQRACPACSESRLLLCPPSTCGSTQGSTLHLGQLGKVHSPMLLKFLDDLPEHRPEPPTGVTKVPEQAAGASCVRPCAPSRSRLF